MARDSQAALVALNRFGFGARGGASGDFMNAASDPRGFVKAELNRPNGVLLEVPGLLSTPALGQAVFAYELEVKQAREAAAKSGAPAPASEAPPPQRRNLSLNTVATDIAGKAAAMESTQANAAMQPTETMQPGATKPAPPPAQPLNIIQKTFRAEALARLQRATLADCGFVERLVVFWSNHFCISANKGGLARMWAGSFEREAIRPTCAGTVRRSAEGGRAASGDAVLSRQPAIARAGIPRRGEPQARAERKSGARNHGAAYARRRRRLLAGRRDLAGAHHHRLDLCRAAGTTRRARQFCL
jgi:uncharacterized protein (DUF1800 family)